MKIFAIILAIFNILWVFNSQFCSKVTTDEWRNYIKEEQDVVAWMSGLMFYTWKFALMIFTIIIFMTNWTSIAIVFSGFLMAPFLFPKLYENKNWNLFFHSLSLVFILSWTMDGIIYEFDPSTWEDGAINHWIQLIGSLLWMGIYIYCSILIFIKHGDNILKWAISSNKTHRIRRLLSKDYNLDFPLALIYFIDVLLLGSWFWGLILLLCFFLYDKSIQRRNWRSGIYIFSISTFILNIILFFWVIGTFIQIFFTNPIFS